MKPSTSLLLACFAFLLFHCKSPSIVSDTYREEESTVNNTNSSLPLSEFLKRVPGVQVSGSGDNAKIRVRGLGTVEGNPNPLLVLDGVDMGYSLADLPYLDGSQISTVRVLKDAVSTSRYGFRGSSGVILIKTHK
ncbi:MAG: TonB-dependent receptor plug domain-containing protein [Bacteroidota bacterium]